jgi:hypothetical protein
MRRPAAAPRARRDSNAVNAGGAMRGTLAGVIVFGWMTVSSGLNAVQDTTRPAADVWTQIGHGIIDLTGTYHQQSGRARQLAWRPDVRQGDRNVFWVGTEQGGLWKAIVNSGGDVVSFIPLTDTFPGPHPMGSFLVHRLDSNKILIGPGPFGSTANDGEIFRTHDQGATWRPHPLHYFDSGSVARLADDRSDGDGNTVLAATSYGIYRSDDFGISWRRRWHGAAVSDIVQDAADPAIWYAAVVQAAPNVILRSTDYGVTWKAMPLGTQRITGGIGRISLATCTSNPDVLYALVVTGNDGGVLNGLYRSLDRGRNWTNIFSDNDPINQDNEGLHTCALGCDPTDANHVFFGLAGSLETFTGTLPLVFWRGLDGHQKSTLNAGHGDFNGVLFRPGHESIALATDGGIYIYHPHADGDQPAVDESLNLLGIEANWQRTLNGLAASRSNPDVFLAGLQDDGVAIGNVAANMVRWALKGDGGQGSIMPDNPLVMTASLNGTAGKFVSFNQGLTWSNINDGLEQQKFASLLIDPTPGLDAPLVFTSKLLGDDSTPPSQIVFRLLDAKLLPLLPPWLPVSPDTLDGVVNHVDHTTNPDVHQLIATLDGHRALFSYSGSRSSLGDYPLVTITPRLQELAEGAPRDAHANADKSTLQPDTIYYTTGASRPSQAFVSTNRGQKWTDVTGNMKTGKKGPDFVKLVANPRNLDQLFLATTEGVFRSDTHDADGPVWVPYSQGLRLNEEIQDIVINVHGLDQPTLYVATKGRGFWKRVVQ